MASPGAAQALLDHEDVCARLWQSQHRLKGARKAAHTEGGRIIAELLRRVHTLVQGAGHDASLAFRPLLLLPRLDAKRMGRGKGCQLRPFRRRLKAFALSEARTRVEAACSARGVDVLETSEWGEPWE